MLAGISGLIGVKVTHKKMLISWKFSKLWVLKENWNQNVIINVTIQLLIDFLRKEKPVSTFDMLTLWNFPFDLMHLWFCSRRHKEVKRQLCCLFGFFLHLSRQTSLIFREFHTKSVWKLQRKCSLKNGLLEDGAVRNWIVFENVSDALLWENAASGIRERPAELTRYAGIKIQFGCLRDCSCRNLYRVALMI